MSLHGRELPYFGQTSGYHQILQKVQFSEAFLKFNVGLSRVSKLKFWYVGNFRLEGMDFVLGWGMVLFG